MGLRWFIAISILIHIIGGTALYLHHNPISPKPTKVIEEISSEDIPNPKDIFVEKPIKKSFRSKPKKKVSKKQNRFFKAPKKKPNLKPKAHFNVSQNQGLSDSRPDQPTLKERSNFKRLNPSFPDTSLNPNHVADSALETKNQKDETTNLNEQEISKESINQEPKANKMSERKALLNPESNLDLKSNPKEPFDKNLMEEVEEPTPDKKQVVDKSLMEEVEEPTPDKKQVVDKSLMEEVEEPTPDKKAKDSHVANKAQKALEQIEKEVLQKANQPSFKNFFELKQKRGNPEIVYPEFARKQKLEGRMVIHYYVSKDGLVDQLSIQSSSGHTKLDNYVLRILSQYEFLSNQETWVKHKLNFSLTGQEIERLNLRQKQ